MTSGGIGDFDIRMPLVYDMRGFPAYRRVFGDMATISEFSPMTGKEDISTILRLIIPYPIVVYHGG